MHGSYFHTEEYAYPYIKIILELPWWFSWLRIPLQCGRLGFNPWAGKIPGEGNSYPLCYTQNILSWRTPWTV